MIRILIVDDSETEIAILKSIFSEEKDFEIIGYAKNGKDAVRLAALMKPDLITMDLQMPIMDGFEATRLIMSQHPTPIVVISSTINEESLDSTFKSMEAGAIGVLPKPENIRSPDFKHKKQLMVDTIRSMAEIKVVKRRFNIPNKKPTQKTLPHSLKHRDVEIITMGASVGGPQALKSILSQLAAPFPVPIAIVQHMTDGFIEGFSKWLNMNTSLTVKMVENNESLQAGVIYFGPDGFHFEITRYQGKLVAKLTPGRPISGFCPSITALFQSVAKACGERGVGILLTGMGNDGAKGLLDLKMARGHTIIQDKASAVVFGMAGVAEMMGAADKIVELDKIADYMNKITAKNKIPI